MDTEKIRGLATAIDKLQSVTFKVEDQSHGTSWKRISMEGLSYLNQKEADQMSAELNAVIEPVLRKYEKTLRKQLALCAG